MNYYKYLYYIAYIVIGQVGMDINRFRKWSLFVGEIVDAWRVIPRILVTLYGVLVWHLVSWFLALETFTKKDCNTALIQSLLDKNIDVAQAQEIACTVVEVVGGPTNAQTAFVTAIVGLATAIFGLYGKGGKDWSKPVKRWELDEPKGHISLSKQDDQSTDIKFK